MTACSTVATICSLLHFQGNYCGRSVPLAAPKRPVVVTVWSRSYDRVTLVRGKLPLGVETSANHLRKGVPDMAYRNKTYVAFASEDIKSYYLMKAWRENDGIEFDFFDAHDINTALDTSQPETIRARLRERLANTKQCVVLISGTTKAKAAKSSTFLYYEVEAISRRGLPVVFANLDGARTVQSGKLPTTLTEPYTISVSFGPSIIKYALDNFPETYAKNLKAGTPKIGPHHYNQSVYDQLGLK